MQVLWSKVNQSLILQLKTQANRHALHKAWHTHGGGRASRLTVLQRLLYSARAWEKSRWEGRRMLRPKLEVELTWQLRCSVAGACERVSWRLCEGYSQE